MKILIIDNTIDRDSWGAGGLCRLARLAPGATIHVRRAPEGDLPKDPLAFDRIILSGSKTSALDDAPWINQLFEFIKKSVEGKKHFLGICYGHQALVRTLGGREYLRRASVAEFGWTHIKVTDSSSILRGLPDSFHSFSAHFEEVSQLPNGMKKLAQSEACGIQACQVKGLPVFGLQFHPEKTPDQAKKVLIERKKLGEPKVLLNPTRTDELYDPILGETIFKNFLKA
jgi:GMP synthase (glutamine-hydrolysing)